MGVLEQGRRTTATLPTTTTATARVTVLVVDDEPLMRTVMKHVLTDEGYAVVTARNAADALALTGGGLHPDLILTDVSMPGMDGVELAARLRTLLPDVPIVFMSAATELQQVAQLDRAEPRNVLEKPFEIDSLARCVRDALQRALVH